MSEVCALCGAPSSRYGCTVRDEGAFCRGPTPPPPSTRPRTLLVKRTHPIPPSAPVVACSLCRAPVVWIIDDDFRRLTVDAASGTEHQPHCPKTR